MKKIVLIAEAMEKGVGKHIIDLYLNLKTQPDIEVYVLYGKKRISENYQKILEQDENFEIQNFQDKIGIKDIKAIIEIKKILKSIKPDVVHCHSSKAGLVGRIAAKLSNVKKIIYSPHAYYFLKFDEKSIKRKIFLIAEKILSKFFTTVTITTSKGEDKTFEKYNIDKFKKKILIEHGIKDLNFTKIEREEERKKYGIKNTDIVIGAMARFEEQKDPVGTFFIMQKILKQNSNVKCIFWGSGTLFEKIKKLNDKLNNKIILPGETDVPEKSLNVLDIYLTASLYEGLPYTLLASLALGLPIIASNVDGNKDCVYEDKNGKLFEAQNYDEAVKKINDLISSNDMMNFKENSLLIFQDKFSINKMIEKYVSLYVSE